MATTDRHPLDPSIGGDYSNCRCMAGFSEMHPGGHCHCDYHNGDHGCHWGNAEFVRRLTDGWRENVKQLAARKVAHALGADNNIHRMTVEEFHALPISNWRNLYRFNLLVILPADDGAELHDSGYRSMSVVGLTDEGELIRLGGGIDNISLDGIGGAKGDPGRRSWQIDCLPLSGLVCLFQHDPISITHPMSTCEVLTRRRPE